MTLPLHFQLTLRWIDELELRISLVTAYNKNVQPLHLPKPYENMKPAIQMSQQTVLYTAHSRNHLVALMPKMDMSVYINRVGCLSLQGCYLQILVLNYLPSSYPLLPTPGTATTH